MASSSNSETPALGRLASLIVLVGGGLYFTGWTYRWAYFSFFQLDVATLPLPVESFYIAAFHALFGSGKTILHTLLAILGVALAVILSLWLLEDCLIGTIQQWMDLYAAKNRLALPAANTNESSLPKREPLLNRLQCGINTGLASRLRKLENYGSLRFLRSLVDEIIIVIWVLTALFWLADYQGRADAWTDAVQATSPLPMVTVVGRDGEMPFGMNMDSGQNPEEIRIIGDREAYTDLRGRSVNYRDDDWRLLIDLDGDYYLFPSLPDASKTDRSPPIVIVPRDQDGDRLIILTPAPPDLE